MVGGGRIGGGGGGAEGGLSDGSFSRLNSPTEDLLRPFDLRLSRTSGSSALDWWS